MKKHEAKKILKNNWRSYDLQLSFYSLTFFIMLSASSCVPEVGQTKLRTKDSSASSNTASSVSPSQGRVLLDNPIILSGNQSLTQTVDLSRLLSSPLTIVDDTFLKASGPCAGLETCFEVKKDNTSTSALQSSSKKWAYPVTDSEFTQVHTFYHTNKIVDQFYQTIYGLYYQAWNLGINQYPTSLPSNLVEWNGTINFRWENALSVFADCGLAGNAYFDPNPSKWVLCFGQDSKYAQVKFAHDPSIIYHEAGHLFISLAMNLRNANSTILPAPYLGTLSYDEAGSIGEGLSDFFSYYVNGRTHIGEWALGRFLKQSRPLSEDDDLHPGGIGTDDASSRLTYPDYLTYDPNYPEAPYEDVHYGGMILSHYLVSQAQDLENQCSLSKKNSSNAIMNIVIETLSELGDTQSKGYDGKSSGDDSTMGRINGSASYSLDYLNILNPINYRSFIQTFAKNLKNTFGNSNLNLCNGTTYAKDRMETLIDKYGLLLFRTYNDHRNEAVTITPATASETVNPANRSHSTLVKKNLIKFDPTEGQPKAFVIDNQGQISSAIAALRSRGLAMDISDQIGSDFGYNNGNGKISRGEVIGLVPNLYNDSNVTMGGIQILANDWDHVTKVTIAGVTKVHPCIYADGDNWPSVAEGGRSGVGTTCETTSVSPKQVNNDDVAPICFVQYNASSSTQWITQEEYMQKIALDKNLCLDPENPKACFFKVIEGTEQATFSKLNPKQNWSSSLKDPQTQTSPSFKFNNVLFFEVSKHIPPGTIFDCRFRVRFSNCDDCFHDQSNDRKNYDYLDKDYNGHKPFQVLHFQFPVVD